MSKSELFELAEKLYEEMEVPEGDEEEAWDDAMARAEDILELGN